MSKPEPSKPGMIAVNKTKSNYTIKKDPTSTQTWHPLSRSKGSVTDASKTASQILLNRTAPRNTKPKSEIPILKKEPKPVPTTKVEVKKIHVDELSKILNDVIDNQNLLNRNIKRTTKKSHDYIPHIK